MTNENRSQSLRNELEDLRVEAAALSEKAKKTARHAEILSEKINHLSKQITKKS